ncbi:MAG: choice-of-anchor tandem repeat GloVer-containing protein [Terriglobales bacterium]
MTTLDGWKTVGIVIALCAVTTTPLTAQTFTTIASFPYYPGAPEFVSLVQGTDGGLYGTTISEGEGGTIFRLGTDGTLSIVYTFCSLPNCADGTLPYSGLIVGTDGNLYGVASGSGAYHAGTVFRLTLAGSLTTLYNFCPQGYPCIDGSGPLGALVEGTDGSFYGTTGSGGAYAHGSVFRITSAGALTTLHSFCAQGNPCPDGFSPEAALTEGNDGKFYGSTFGGGGNADAGTLFKITRSGVFTTLWNFSQDFAGSGPAASLVQLGDGKFYGTTTGRPNNFGTIFSVTKDGRLVVLYTFCPQGGCPFGGGPSAPLALGTDGKLYGTTVGGGSMTCGSAGCGTIFQAAKGKFKTLYDFCPQNGCLDGMHPIGGLTQGTNGVFYGTTPSGGIYGGGTAFSLDMGLGPFVTFARGAGRVGQTGPILGQGFTGTTSVLLNGTPASFTVVSDTLIKAMVPAGATTGYVTVTTPSGTLTSNVPFHVLK